jgi:mannitol-specific phosphotransferase system IIBC component
MDLTSVLVQLISGAVGGNVAGLANKARSLGPLINTILGALGGLGGGQVAGGTMGDNVAAEAGVSAVVGALLPLIVGMLKKKA